MCLPGSPVPVGLSKLSSVSGHWACQHLLLIMFQFSLTSLVLFAMLLASLMSSGEGSHAFTGSAPSKFSKRAKSCTYLFYPACIGPVPEPLVLSADPHIGALTDRCTGRLFDFRPGAHTSLCPWAGIDAGDERHCVSEFSAIMAFVVASSTFLLTMGDERLLVWHTYQKDVASCLLQLSVSLAQTHERNFPLRSISPASALLSMQPVMTCHPFDLRSRHQKQLAQKLHALWQLTFLVPVATAADSWLCHLLCNTSWGDHVDFQLFFSRSGVC